MAEDFNSSPVEPQAAVSNKRIIFIVYILQAAGLFIGLPFIGGVIIDYIKRADLKGSWLESHCRWQIRTFWFSLLWAFVGIVTYVIVVGHFILVADGIWIIYRIIKGLLYLNEGRTMYPEKAPTGP